MIGAVVGGLPSMRMGSALQSAELESLDGRRVVVVSGMPKTFPVVGRAPLLLAPGFEQSRDVDVVAECFEAERGVMAAARFFADAVCFGQGNETHRDSNDRFWSQSMHGGLMNFFQSSGILACEEEFGRSLGNIMNSCVVDLRGQVARAAVNSRPEYPEWMEQLPEVLKSEIAMNYLGKATPMAVSHLSTLSIAVSEINRTAPRKWTEPFVASPDGEPIYIYAPSWGNAPLYALLQVALKSGVFFLMPELHLWPEKERLRVGHFLQYESHRTDAVWTSLSRPLHPGYESGWEMFGRSSGYDVLSFFRERLHMSGMEGESRLKDLAYETPASLDDGHVLLRSASGWEVRPASLFPMEKLGRLSVRSVAARDGGALKENMSELKRQRDRQKLEKKRLTGNSGGKGHIVRIVEEIPELCAEEGKCSLYALGSETILLEDAAVLSEKAHLAVLGGYPGKPQQLFALYEKLWEAVIPPECEPFGPRVNAFLPLSVECGSTLRPRNGELKLFSPLLGKTVRLLTHGLESVSFRENPVAFGTWLAPQSVFLVRSLLKCVFLPEPSGDGGRYSESGGTMRSALPGVSARVLEDGRALSERSCALLERLEREGDFSAVLEEEDEIATIRSRLDNEAFNMMEELLESDALKGMWARRGFLRYDLGDVRAPGHPSNVFSLVDIKDLPPAEYTTQLQDGGFNNECILAFSRVFAMLLLNTGIKAAV